MFDGDVRPGSVLRPQRKISPVADSVGATNAAMCIVMFWSKKLYHGDTLAVVAVTADGQPFMGTLQIQDARQNWCIVTEQK